MFNSNINPGAVQEQYNNSKAPAREERKDTGKLTDEERMKKYLSVRLDANEQSRDMFIRLLPITKDAQTPFALVYAHKVRVSKEVAPSGFKTILCPVKNHNVEGEENCPFCVIASEAAANKKGLNRESQTYKDFNSIEYANTAKPMWVCRCIERGKEADGPKWWMFSHQEKKSDGYYDKIMSIDSSQRKMRRDDNYTIFDLNRGRDLMLTITRTKDDKGATSQKIDIQLCNEDTPLTTDIEMGLSWINTEDDWKERYKFKNYDYMSVLAEGGVPVYDKEQRAYVNKNAQEEKKEEQPTQAPQTSYSYNPQQQMPAPVAQPTQQQAPTMQYPTQQNPAAVHDVPDDLPF